MAFYFWKRRNELAPAVGTVTEGGQRVQRT
jgi:hypothetical protein